MDHYQDEIDRLKKMYTEEFKDHQLMEQGIVYSMHKPGTMIMSVWIAFFSKRICVTGDAIIEGHGVVSTVGYGKGWFVGRLGEDYLGEKFLFTRWVPEAAKDFVDDELEAATSINCEEEKVDQERIDALWDIKNSHSWEEHEFGQIWEAHAIDCEDWPSRRYDPRAISMLSVIQQRFRELYKEMP